MERKTADVAAVKIRDTRTSAQDASSASMFSAMVYVRVSVRVWWH